MNLCKVQLQDCVRQIATIWMEIVVFARKKTQLWCYLRNLWEEYFEQSPFLVLFYCSGVLYIFLLQLYHAGGLVRAFSLTYLSRMLLSASPKAVVWLALQLRET